MNVVVFYQVHRSYNPSGVESCTTLIRDAAFPSDLATREPSLTSDQVLEAWMESLYDSVHKVHAHETFHSISITGVIPASTLFPGKELES